MKGISNQNLQKKKMTQKRQKFIKDNIRRHQNLPENKQKRNIRKRLKFTTKQMQNRSKT